MTLTYKKQGLLTAQRQVHVPWNGYAVAETVKMISEDPVSTTFSFDGNPATIKTHRSTMHTDSFGRRTTTVVFTGDNRAYLTDKDGNPGQILNTITTRATEYTAPDSMPAILPPNSAYTFCTELTVDGAQRVRFQKPVVMWVENFLGFPVGSAVPVGYYDRDRAVWVPSNNGKVVQLLDTNGDGIVDAIDATGSGEPTDLNHNGSVGDEAIGLDDPSKYASRATYWRVEVAHFSPWDCNWPFGPPPDATPPNPDGPPDTDSNPPDKDDTSKTCGIGSYAEDRSRAVHEDIPIPGTDMTLHYSSKRAKGYTYTFSVPASGAAVPLSLKNIHVRVEVAGRTFERVLPPLPYQKAEFSWDGLDVWGKRVIGSVNANIRIGFEYGAFYYGADTSANARAFARAGMEITNISSRQNLFSWIDTKMSISLPPAADVGWSHIAEGWTISMHHYLNPSNPTPLFRGDGSTNSNNIYTINTVAGDGSSGLGDLGDGGSALKAKLRAPMDIAVDAAGNLYILDAGHFVIRKVDTAGIITTVAGRPGELGYSGDGRPAVDALLHPGYGGLSVDASGNIYFSDYNNRRIRKVDSSGIITTVAGNGDRGYSGDGGPAVDATLGDVEDIALDIAGNLYIHDRENNCIRKVDAGGIITTVAGNGPAGEQWCDICPAVNTHIRESNNIAVDANGNLYIGNTSLNRIRKVDTAGMMTTVAGNGKEAAGISDGPALATPITPVTLAADPSGNLYFINNPTSTLHKVDTNGTLTKVAGNGTPGYSGDGGPAINAQLYHGSIAVNAQRDIYVVDPSYYNVVRKIALALSRTDAGGDIHFADDDGLVHLFSSAGSHKKSIDVNTGVILRGFGYNANNQLISVTDQFGRQTFINRDSNGTARSITSPEGITTNLSIDANGHLKNISYPAGETYRFDYSSAGLLTAKTEPNGNRFDHSFDSNGRLMVAGDEEGGSWRFNRTVDVNGDIISTVTTGEGNVTQYWDRIYATGAVDSSITNSSGAGTTYSRSSDGFTVNKSLSCGMNVSLRYDLDPRYGLKVVKEMTNSTPSSLRQSTIFNKTYTDTNTDGVIDRISETITQNNKTSTFEQDTLLAEKRTISPAGRVLTSFYNPANLLTTKLTIPGFHDTNLGYNREGRLTTLNRNTRTTTFDYNDKGFLGSITDPENKTISYIYDAIGRVIQVNRPDG
ncbi:MAG TPA: hypothetical protein DCZ97_08605, partial [Syntrophus sp. (in: bacteria)]|nr:hypothetical protein [Syntrophus sp. (in: bacteria)]